MDPALIGLVGVIVGVVLSNLAVRYLDSIRRRERMQDVRTAIRAEIRSHRARLLLFEPASSEQQISEKLMVSPGFTPFIPREPQSFVFEAIVAEIHILPTQIIDPTIYYYRQIATLAQFAEDLRSDRYLALEPNRKLEMYKDYVAMGRYALQLADEAIAAIEKSSVSRSRTSWTRDWFRRG